jgi:la-related protein 1
VGRESQPPQPKSSAAPRRVDAIRFSEDANDAADDDDDRWESDWVDDDEVVVRAQAQDEWISVAETKRSGRKSGAAEQPPAGSSPKHRAPAPSDDSAAAPSVEVEQPASTQAVSPKASSQKSNRHVAMPSDDASVAKEVAPSPSSVSAVSPAAHPSSSPPSAPKPAASASTTRPPSSSAANKPATKAAAKAAAKAAPKPAPKPKGRVENGSKPKVHEKESNHEERRGSDSTGGTSASTLSNSSNSSVEEKTSSTMTTTTTTTTTTDKNLSDELKDQPSNATMELKRMLNLSSSSDSDAVPKAKQATTPSSNRDSKDEGGARMLASSTKWPSNSSISDTSSGSPPPDEADDVQQSKARSHHEQQQQQQQQQQQHMVMNAVPMAAHHMRNAVPAPHPHATVAMHPHALVPPIMMHPAQPTPGGLQVVPPHMFMGNSGESGNGGVVASPRMNAPMVQLDVSAQADPQRTTTVRRQIEYYFSAQNLCHDMYLRSKMDAEGYVPVSVLVHFNKIRVINPCAADLLEALKKSDTLEAKIPWALRASNLSHVNYDALMSCQVRTRTEPSRWVVNHN